MGNEQATGTKNEPIINNENNNNNTNNRIYKLNDDYNNSNARNYNYNELSRKKIVRIDERPEHNHSLKGFFRKDFKRIPKIFRIYLCSSYIDFQEEISFLVKYVYPRLRVFCQKLYELELQIVDMRWGLGYYYENEFINNERCIDEINICCNESIIPCFIVLFGNKYGELSLPDIIPKDEFERIQLELRILKESKKSQKLESDMDVVRDFISKCYRLDENRRPNVYQLIGLYSPLFGYHHSSQQNYTLSGRQTQREIENKVRTFLQWDVENIRIKTKKTNDPDFFSSMLEQELYHAIFRTNNRHMKTLAFFREISDIRDVERNENKALFNDYFDTNYQSSELKELKKKIVNNLPKEDVHQFMLDWSFGKGVTLSTHRRYFNDFEHSFQRAIMDILIREEITKIKSEPLYDEVLQHWYYSDVMVSDFVEIDKRDGLIKSVIEYVEDKENLKPLIIHGEVGTGKTSIIARISKIIQDYIPDSKEYTVILRYIGTTPNTENISKTFQSIIKQLNLIYNLNTEFDVLSKDFTYPKSIILDTILDIRQKYPDQKLIFLFDGIDQLNKKDHHLNWMFYELPRNCKFIYAIRSSTEMFEMIKTQYVYRSNYLELNDFDKTVAIKILKIWLTNESRSLLEDQWRLVDTLFRLVKINPFYLSLLFQIILTWHSYVKPEARFFQCLTVDDCISYIFEKVEQKHQILVFSRCMFYMNIIPYGVQDTEIEQIMSNDSHILTILFPNLNSSARRFPIALWLLIKNDLKHFLTYKHVDGVQVVAWRYKAFQIYAETRYMKFLQPKETDELILIMLNYCLTNWEEELKTYPNKEERRKFDSKKPFVFNNRLIRLISHLVFSLNDKYLKTVSLKKYIYYNCNFVYAVACSCETIFIEKSDDIWKLYNYFDNLIKERQYDDDNPIGQLAMVSYSYLKNHRQMSFDPNSISSILSNDLIKHNNEESKEISDLIRMFNEFL